MMKYTGENKLAAMLDDLLAYIELTAKESRPVNMNSVTVRIAIRLLSDYQRLEKTGQI